MPRRSCKLTFLIILVSIVPTFAADWKAGLAKTPITPQKPLWLGGYGARTHPSEGTLQELYARALVLEDETGNQAALVTTDVLGIPAGLASSIAQRAQEQYGLSRDRLLLSSTHTHAGPVLRANLAIAYSMTDEESAQVNAYTAQFEDKIIQLIGIALENLQPARLSFGRTEVTFGVNRRVKKKDRYVIGVNRGGPVDHEVPFLVVDGEEGNLRGLVFSYACHNTTIPGRVYHFHGDYAGTAQTWLEYRYPGSVAFFMMGCGADANPYPRGTVKLADEHGQRLARTVDKSLTGPLRTVQGPLKTAFEVFPVAFSTTPSRETLQARVHGDDGARQRHARQMLKILDQQGQLPSEYPYPLQVWQFGNDLTLVAMAGEVVVDYNLRLKQELGADKLWVTAYNNDVFAYLPSLRVLQEGGYEADYSMIYYGHPAPFAPSIEETVINKVHELVKKVRSQ